MHLTSLLKMLFANTNLFALKLKGQEGIVGGDGLLEYHKASKSGHVYEAFSL